MKHAVSVLCVKQYDAEFSIKFPLFFPCHTTSMWVGHAGTFFLCLCDLETPK